MPRGLFRVCFVPSHDGRGKKRGRMRMIEETVKMIEPVKVADPVLEIEHLHFYYGSKEALRDISLTIPRQRVTAFIGPSGCGKSTLLRCFNRMNDLIEGVRITGQVHIGGQEINNRQINVIQLSTSVDMVFQPSNPFPKSNFDTVAYGMSFPGR